MQGEAGDIGDDVLVAVAEELFLDRDAREAGKPILSAVKCGSSTWAWSQRSGPA